MRALMALLIILFCIYSVVPVGALSSMPVTGGDPYPMVIATILIIVLIIVPYAVVGIIARRKIDRLRRDSDLEGLARALNNPFLANRAARALGEMRDERALEPLIGALQDRNEDVRCEAARALGEIGDPRAEEPLERATRDEYRQVRDSATGAIKRIHRSA
jgi:hypothetical protein